MNQPKEAFNCLVVCDDCAKEFDILREDNIDVLVEHGYMFAKEGSMCDFCAGRATSNLHLHTRTLLCFLINFPEKLHR